MGVMRANIVGFCNDWTYDDIPARTDVGVEVDGYDGLYTLRWHRCRSVVIHPYEGDDPQYGTGRYVLSNVSGGTVLYDWFQADINAYDTYQVNGAQLFIVVGSPVLPATPGASPWLNFWQANGTDPYPDTLYTNP